MISFSGRNVLFTLYQEYYQSVSKNIICFRKNLRFPLEKISDLYDNDKNKM